MSWAFPGPAGSQGGSPMAGKLLEEEGEAGPFPSQQGRAQLQMAFSGMWGRWLVGGRGRVKGGEGEGGKSSLEAPTCMLWFLRPEIHFGFWTIPRPTLLKNLLFFFLILLTSSSSPSFPHPPNPFPGPRRGLQPNRALTRVWLVAVVTLSEVLWVLDDGNAGHADHHRVWASIQGRGRRDAVVDVVEGTSWILLSADHCHGTCKHHTHPSGTTGERGPTRPADKQEKIVRPPGWE